MRCLAGFQGSRDGALLLAFSERAWQGASEKPRQEARDVHAMCIDIGTGVGKNICLQDHAKKAEKTTPEPSAFSDRQLQVERGELGGMTTSNVVKGEK
jgi:hypothetical protein